jgi:aminobenzoyl-glutamate utilization protein B
MKNITLGFMLLSVNIFAQKEFNPKVKSDKPKEFVINQIEKNSALYKQVAKDIWGYAELGFKETQSTIRLQSVLSQAGFTVQAGVSGMPTAFVATYGASGPVIGILAEFDALPGLSQDSVFTKDPLIESGAGHACGHNLFGTASTAAAVALKTWLADNKIPGTIKVFGTPAEEGGSAKVYMVRDGLFNGVDAVLHWHPSNANDASPSSCLAIKQTMFRFYGRSSHAAAAPQAGRSALDGLEAMNYMVNLMREHVPQEARIHYIINKGGLAANVVPDFAEAEYMVRHPDARVVEEIWERIVQASQGAAQGTGTTTKHEVISGSYNLMPNETLAKVMYENLVKVGGVIYTPAEVEFAKQLQSTLNTKAPDLSMAQAVQPFKVGGFFPASTDVGDITWVVPTAGLGTATWVPGVPAHSWQAVATGGRSIGLKGMLNAAKIIAMTGVDLFLNPAIMTAAQKELETKLGPGFQYKSMIGDRKPPLDFREGKN